VVNFDLPREGDSYVHRVGRTARAGLSGCAYSLVTEQDLESLTAIERFLKQPIRRMETPVFASMAPDMAGRLHGGDSVRQQQRPSAPRNRRPDASRKLDAARKGKAVQPRASRMQSLSDSAGLPSVSEAARASGGRSAVDAVRERVSSSGSARKKSPIQATALFDKIRRRWAATT
jgi:superfamily II DNA/RNA helicase